MRLVVSAALIGFLLYRIDLQKLWNQFQQTQWVWLLPALVAYLLSQLISSQRWRLVAEGVDLTASRGQFLRWYMEGMFFSLCLPTSIGGDVIKWYRLANPPGVAREGGRLFLAGCSVLVDRITGLLALMAIGLAAVAVAKYDLPLGYGVLLLGAILAVEAACMRLITPALKAGGWLTKRIARLAGLIGKLEPYGHSPQILRAALGLSVLVQVLNLGVPVMMAKGMGLDVPVHAVLVAAAITSISAALPISINGVGVRESLLVVLLHPYGVEDASAMALGLLWFLVVVIGGLLAGLSWLVEPQRLPDTQAGEDEVEPSQASA